MADWEWQAYDLLSGARLGSIEMSDWSHTDTLNDAGSFSATMIGRTAPIRREYLGYTTVGKTVIVPVRDGVPLGFAGIIWQREPPRIAGAGLLSYFDRRRLYETKQYLTPGTDQHLVVKDLVDWVQAHNGNILIDTSQVTASGVLRIQTWNAWELKNIGQAIRQKGDNLNGYEFDIRVEYDAGNLVRRLRLWTPRRGRYYVDSQSNPTFEYDGRRGNILSPPATPVDGLDMGTDSLGQGEEIDAATHERLIARKTNTVLLAAGWAQLDRVLDLSDVKVQATLQEHVDGDADLHRAAELGDLKFQVDPTDETWPWGSWDLGDDARVRIPPGDTTPWMPDGFDAVQRVKTHEWRWSSKQGEQLDVTAGRLLGE